MTSHVELDNVHKRLGSYEAVAGISLQITQGEFLTLLGPSGCGKTTTLRLIAGFLTPTLGEIYIRGNRVDRLPPYLRNTGMVFQSYALFPHKTVYQNIAFGLRMRNKNADDIRKQVTDVVNLVRLEGLEERYPRQLSGGQQQRVALARALVIEPDVLLLDEPLSNLDFKLRQQMRLEVKAIQRRIGITTIYVTHDQGEALAMSDRIAIMHNGKVEQVGTPREVFERPRNSFVADFIGEANFLKGELSLEIGYACFHIKGGPDVRLEVVSESLLETLRSSSNRRLPVLACIRPRNIRIERKRTQTDNSLEGTIQSIVYSGSEARVQVWVADYSLVAYAKYTEESALNVEDSVYVEWEPRDIRLIASDELK